jgi:hypothetical protein
MKMRGGIREEDGTGGIREEDGTGRENKYHMRERGRGGRRWEKINFQVPD